MLVAKTPYELIEELINHWACWDEHELFYLTKLAPSLVADFSSGDETEKLILAELRPKLSDQEWSDLPQLIAEKRSGILRVLESERLLREAHERARQEEARERIRQEQIRKQVEELRVAMLQKLHNQFNSDFLSAPAYFLNTCTDILTQKEFEYEKLSFVKSWIKANISCKNGSIQLPDVDQIAAISAVNRHTQVVARAGSGKTSTIVNRSYFLQKHCGVAPGEIMLLAFNRKAANEIAERLEKLCGTSIPHVMTFHALARAIVNPKQELIYNDSLEENQGLDSVFGDVIKDRLSEDTFLERVRKLMIAQFKDDWDDIVAGGYDLTPEQLYRYQKNLARETLRGGYVKSHGEKVIANFLFEHGIPYIYEKTHYIQGKACHPDFTILPNTENVKGVVIEYFGLAGTDLEYDKQMEEKQQHWVAEV